MASTDFEALNTGFAESRPKDIIRHAFEQHSTIGVSFSGAEDVILVDMAVNPAAATARIRHLPHPGHLQLSLLLPGPHELGIHPPQRGQRILHTPPPPEPRNES